MADLSLLTNNAPDKVILVGDVGVGKTSIFSRFSTGKFGYSGKEAEAQKTWPIQDVEVSITLFDTAGMERHLSTIPHTYFRSAKVLLLVYSLDDKETFDSLTSWAENATSARTASRQDSIITAIVGNKLDLESSRDVSEQRVKSFASLNEIDDDLIFEVSALEDRNLQEMFDTIALKVHPLAAETIAKNSQIGKTTSNKKGKCCS